MTTSAADYEATLAEAAVLFPGVRIGKPGRTRAYWGVVAVLRLLRLALRVRLDGVEQVATGPAVLIGNHVDALDPLVVVMGTRWRVTAFTKLEWFTGRLAPFFRAMGQIPLRRGDEASTAWAMQMARLTLDDGGMIGLYPEGTRSPDPGVLHRLHKRVMIPLLQAAPDVPVHAIATTYRPRHGLRRHVVVRVSATLQLDAGRRSADEVTADVRDALLALSGQAYSDQYARDVKKRRTQDRRRDG